MADPSGRPDHPDQARRLGTLITLAPAAGTLSHLLRSAIDAEQVGATRIHLASDQQDIVAVVAGLRRQTDLVITIAPDHPAAELVDRMPSDFSEVVLDEGPDDVDLVAEVVRIDREHPHHVSLAGRGHAGLTVLFAALAVGAHLRVGTADTPANPIRQDLTDDPRTAGRDDAALVARASGLARLAGRPPLDAAAARAWWRVG